MTFKSFGKLTVKNPSRPDDMPTILTFINPLEQWDAYEKLKGFGYEIVDNFFGYKLYRKHDEAVDDAIAVLGEVKR